MNCHLLSCGASACGDMFVPVHFDTTLHLSVRRLKRSSLFRLLTYNASYFLFVFASQRAN